MLPYVLVALIILGYFISLPKLFVKAGKKAWEGYIPIWRNIVWLEILGMPRWRVIFLLVPGVNVLMLWVMNYELARAFGKRKFLEVTEAILLPFLFFPRLAWSKNLKWQGPTNWEDIKKPAWMEWRDALVYATIAATTLNLFTFQAYTIPSPSMEGSLMTGDYLFVSKLHYGPRMPNTPLGVPFTANRLPGSMTPSYLEWFNLPYLRLPGFSEVKHNDPMVFNFPSNDTFIVDETLSGHNYYLLKTQMAWDMSGRSADFEQNKSAYLAQAHQELENEYGISTRPVDRRENYVKRCVGLPGDELAIVDRQLMINGEAAENPEGLQFKHWLEVNAPFGDAVLQQHGIRPGDVNYIQQGDLTYAIIPARPAVAEELSRFPNVLSMEVQNLPSGFDYKQHPYHPQYNPMFPNEANYGWTEDNYGPIYIPEAGATVDLNLETLPLYRRIIEVFEGHTLAVDGETILIDGNEANTYTFDMNYYWLMGDNRHSSLDSRYWGFVPEDHVIGKPTLIWYSREDGQDVRWDRMFTIPK